MKREFCIAAARLIFDLVGADGYVSDRELDIMEGLLNSKYGLNNPDRAYEINKMTFCDAVQVLQEWDDEKDVETLLDELKLIAGVGRLEEKGQRYSRLEGYCSLSEAWLLLAIEYAIHEKARVFSVGKSDYRFSRSEIIYLENSNTSYSLNNEMDNYYNEYKARLEVLGMRLVYIPKVCAYLKKKREQRKLKALMRYVSPFHRYEDSDAQKIVDNIDRITTKDFAQDLFSEDVRLYNNLKPSFLLKIGTSVIEDENLRKQSKSNFMLLPIEGSISETLHKALHIYQRYTLDLHIPERKLNGRPFRLHGFDRTFLNFVMSHILNTDVLSKILFDFSFGPKKVYFIFDEKRTISIPLGNKQMCLFLLIILFTTYKNGVPLERVIRKKTGFKMDVEKVFLYIYNKVKENSDGELYDSKGKLTNDIARLALKMKDIPLSYHVVTIENRVLINYPINDIVYIRFNKEQKLLEREIEKIKEKDCKMSFESICCELFH